MTDENRPVKKGSSLHRVAAWRAQHDGEIRGHGLQRVVKRSLSQLGHIRLDAQGQLRSKVYDRKGKR